MNSLVGARVYVQGVVLDSGVNRAGAVVSNAAACVIGS